MRRKVNCMSPNEVRAVPVPSLRRLPAYLRILKQLQKTGERAVSCTYLAEKLGQDATQVRKDLAYTGVSGRPKVGYELDVLVTAIEHFLGWDNVTDAFLAGAGYLGSALLGYQGFMDHGLHIVAAFDSDPRKIGTEIYGRDVLAVGKLPDLSRRMHIRIGIITVPAAAAQHVADLMIKGGIRAIWNFAPVHLTAPDNILIENEHLSASLAVISQRLATMDKREKV